jgi:hypothetical protein
MDAYEGWADDPFGAHEVRYFVDGRPTKLVRDGSMETFDDLPPKATRPAFPTAIEPPTETPSRESAFAPLDPTPEPVLEVTSAPVPEPVLEPAPYPAAPLASAPAPTSGPPLPPGASYWAPPPPPDVLPHPPARGAGEPGWSPPPSLGPFETFVVGSVRPPRRRRRRRLVTGLVALVLAATAGLVFAVDGGMSAEAEAAVIRSVNTTMANRTAHVSMNVAVSTPSGNVTGTGTGDIDFGQNAMQLDLTVGVPGHELQMQAVYLAGSIYEQIPGIGRLIPGKSWISLDLSSLGASGVRSPSALGTGDNPAAMLRLLTEEGNTVVPLGSSTIGGTPVQGYSVSLDPASIKAQLANANLPAWMTTALSQVDVQNTTLKVFVDGSGLLRRFTLGLTETVSASVKVTVDENLDFSDYGAAVNVTAPPPDQVASFSQFLQDAQASGTTSAS